MIEQNEVLKNMISWREYWLTQGLGNPQVFQRDEANQLQMSDQPHFVVFSGVELVALDSLLNIGPV